VPNEIALPLSEICPEVPQKGNIFSNLLVTVTASAFLHGMLLYNKEMCIKDGNRINPSVMFP
jgi:hypothetical protein